jgi:hypothetical protein
MPYVNSKNTFSYYTHHQLPIIKRGKFNHSIIDKALKCCFEEDREESFKILFNEGYLLIDLSTPTKVTACPPARPLIPRPIQIATSSLI